MEEQDFYVKEYSVIFVNWVFALSVYCEKADKYFYLLHSALKQW